MKRGSSALLTGNGRLSAESVCWVRHRATERARETVHWVTCGLVARAGTFVRNAGRSAVWAILLTLVVTSPGGAQAPSVDELIRLALAPKPSDAYTMRADYDALLTVRYGG